MDFPDPTKTENWRFILIFCALLLLSTVLLLWVDAAIPFNFLPWGGPISLLVSLYGANWIIVRLKLKP